MEEITITYTDLLKDGETRRSHLKYQWHFLCNCQRCLDPTDLKSFLGAVKCPHCKLGNLNLLLNTLLENLFSFKTHYKTGNFVVFYLKLLEFELITLLIPSL